MILLLLLLIIIIIRITIIIITIKHNISNSNYDLPCGRGGSVVPRARSIQELGLWLSEGLNPVRFLMTRGGIPRSTGNSPES